MAKGANGVAAYGIVSTEIAGESVQLWPGRGMFWPAASTLIVADLHWGKSETFHAAGVPIPDGVLEHDLARLSGMLAATGASRLLVLGDLIHSGVGLTDRVVGAVAAWRSRHRVRVELVPGNHDRHAEHLPEAWGIARLGACVREGPLVFCHDPVQGGGEYMLSGHVHPMARLADGAGPMRLPCFVLGAGAGLLPAFSAFTRGETVYPGAGDRVYAIAESSVVALPVKRLEPARPLAR